MQPMDVNPHLRFQDGDIAFFAEQSLAAWEIELEFLARKLVLEAADREDVVIQDPGELAHAASKVYSTLYQRTRKSWGE